MIRGTMQYPNAVRIVIALIKDLGIEEEVLKILLKSRMKSYSTNL